MQRRDLLALVMICTATWTGPVPPPALASISYTTNTVERWDPECPAPTSQCPHITFTYPVMEPGPHPAAATAINLAVRDFLLTSVGEPRRYKNIEAEMDAFMSEAQEYQKTARGQGAYWEERIVTVPYESRTIVSLRFDLGFFSGACTPSPRVRLRASMR